MAYVDVSAAPKGFSEALLAGFFPFGMTVTGLSETSITVRAGDYRISLTGAFTFDADEELTGGLVAQARIEIASQGVVISTFQLSTPIIAMVELLASKGLQGLYQAMLAGNDTIQGAATTAAGDVLYGYGGDDDIRGVAGNDTIFGGSGNDKIYGPSDDTKDTRSYLRGEDGNDQIYGAAGFDDINGNTGDDTCLGGPGSDWVVGGQGNDLLYGDGSSPYAEAYANLDDVVYGNLGNDTCHGGAGADWVRGGQGDDVLYGEAGDDWMAGDRGSDTLSGGAGADVFYGFKGVGLDRVTDFSRAEGDRIQLAPGTAYTLRQEGSDAVIDLGDGDRIVLVGVQSSSLSGDWLFFA